MSSAWWFIIRPTKDCKAFVLSLIFQAKSMTLRTILANLAITMMNVISLAISAFGSYFLISEGSFLRDSKRLTGTSLGYDALASASRMLSGLPYSKHSSDSRL
jgi:hypothetical protein